MHERVISRTHPGAVGMLLTVVGAAVLTAVCAQVSFGYPVPTTLQTFAVLGSAAFLGARRGAAGQLLYLGAGAVGLPVFADGHGGIDWLTQANPLHASGGYLWGYPIAAFVVGWICERYGRSFYVTVPAMLARERVPLCHRARVAAPGDPDALDGRGRDDPALRPVAVRRRRHRQDLRRGGDHRSRGAVGPPARPPAVRVAEQPGPAPYGARPHGVLGRPT